MIKNEEKKQLATRVLREVSGIFWVKSPEMSVCALSACTGLNRSALARYLTPGAATDLPIAALRLICDALDLPLDDVIPFPTVLDNDNKYDSVSVNHRANLKDLNDIYVERLRTIIKDKYPTGTYYHLSEATNDFLTEAGLRNAFRKKSDGHYPLMSLSVAVAIADAMRIYPDNIFN